MSDHPYDEEYLKRRIKVLEKIIKEKEKIYKKKYGTMEDVKKYLF